MEKIEEFINRYESKLLSSLRDLKIEVLGNELNELDPDDWDPYYLPIEWIIPLKLRKEVIEIGMNTAVEDAESVIDSLVADYISERRTALEMSQLSLKQAEEAEYLDYWYLVQEKMEVA